MFALNLRNVHILEKQMINGVARSVADSHGYIPVGVNAGMLPSRIAAYTQSVLNNFGYRPTNVIRHVLSVNNVRTQLSRGLPFPLAVLDISNHVYRNHGVAAYAYTQLRRTSDGSTITFVKVSDGWVSAGRFVALAIVSSQSTGAMWMWSSNLPALQRWVRP